MIFDHLAQDLRYALRGLRLKPGFALAVIITLGLGIGANAAMFGIVDRLLFRPPPLLRDPATAHRVYLYETYRGKEQPGGVSEYARYADLARWTTSFSRAAGYAKRDLAIGVGESARERPVAVVSASFFGFFDAPPALGRYFTDAEDRPPLGTNVAVLSYPMWRVQYGGRKDVLGSAIQIGSALYTVIGVAAPQFVGLWPDEPPVAYVPITSYGAAMAANLIHFTVPWWETYSWGWMDMMVRRKPEVAIAAANADLTQAFVRSYRAELQEHTRMAPLEVARPHGTVASILYDRGPNATSVSKVATWVAAMSIIVLLIACANVTNLLVARALRRRREIAVRLALGVPRRRLVSQLLTESLMLGALGGALGIVIATWGGALLRAGFFKSEAAAGFRDPRTVFYAAVAAVIVGLLTGLAPILQTRHADLTGDLRAGTREGTYARSRTRSVLLVLQGALSVLLLIGAGLFVRSLDNVRGVRLGYDVDPVMMVSLEMRGAELDSARKAALRRRLLEVVREVPGVEHASLQTSMPFWSMWSTGLFVTGIDTVRRLGRFDLNAVSPDYFPTVGTRILRGRGITDADAPGPRPTSVVVSEAMGKALWPGKDPIGQCIRVGADTMPCTYVVGIAENIKDQSLSADSGYYYYLPATQWSPAVGGLFVRTRGNATEYRETVRKRLQREMPGASYVTITPFSEIIGEQTRSWQLGATMFVVFGGLALVLAAVGLYSVLAYTVTQRTHELGVRVALGAQRADVIRLVVMHGLRVAGAGVAIGALIALWGAKWVKPLLFDVSPRDPVVFGGVVTTLVAVAVAASWLPARRASRVDPNVALRTD